MNSTPMASPSVFTDYSSWAMVLIGLLVGAAFLFGGISLIYWINTRMRRAMKASRDDWRIEKDIEGGHTLHAEGIYGSRHPEEGGLHLKQEDPHPATALFKPGLTAKASGAVEAVKEVEEKDPLYESQKERSAR